MRLGWQELVVILIILVVIFGGTRLAGLGKAVGKTVREFKEEVTPDVPAGTAVPQAAAPQASAPQAVTQAPAPAVAATVTPEAVGSGVGTGAVAPVTPPPSA
ncbi:MAG: twin-arginine translocase TatA/TatE family subunit [Cellulomonadaceae bacterium]|jgi:sec-independent protein translocase protein TatA|nr:twin-arginine translocase TatA/TatE family subunit [Cellulomonadaceae bacterium]